MTAAVHRYRNQYRAALNGMKQSWRLEAVKLPIIYIPIAVNTDQAKISNQSCCIADISAFLNAVLNETQAQPSFTQLPRIQH